MNMGMLGMRGRQTQWTSMIQMAYATKIDPVTKNAAGKPTVATRPASRNTDPERNRSMLATWMAQPKNQTDSERNRAKLAAVLSK